MSDALWQVLVVVLFAAAILQATALIAVMRQVGGLLVRLNPTGVKDLESGGPDVDTLVDLPVVAHGRAALVVFASPACTLCRYLEAAIPAIRSNYKEIEVVVAVMGAEDEAERVRYARRFGDAGRDLPTLAREWNVQGTPFAVGLDADHRVRVRGVANTLDHLESVAETILLPLQEPEDAETADSHTNGELATAAHNGNAGDPDKAGQHAGIA